MQPACLEPQRRRVAAGERGVRERDLRAVGADFEAAGRAQMQAGSAGGIAPVAFQTGARMVAQQSPVRQAAVEVGIGNIIIARGSRPRFHVVHQTFAGVQQSELHERNASAISRAVVHRAGEFDVCPRRLAGVVAVGPIQTAPLVRASVNQLQAAAAAVGPAAPAAAGAVGDLVHDDVQIIRGHVPRSIRAGRGVRHRQCDLFAGVGQFSAEIADGVRRVELRVVREQISRVASDHQIIARAQRLICRKRPTDAAADFPARQTDGIGSVIEQFNVLRVVAAHERVIHDFVETHRAHQRSGVVGAKSFGA